MTITSKQREYHNFFQLPPEEGKIKMSNTKARFDLAGWLRPNSMNNAYKMLDDNFSVTSVTSVNSYLDDHHPNDQSMELNVQRSIDTTYSLDKILKSKSLDVNQHLYLPKKDVSIDEWRFQGKQSETI